MDIVPDCVKNELTGNCDLFQMECVDVFSEWGHWGWCVPDCVEGYRTRSRKCINEKGNLILF